MEKIKLLPIKYWRILYLGLLRPVESHSGARETILAGPYHNLQPHSVGAEIETPEALERREGGNVGGVSPHHPTRGLGERRISSSSGAENGFYAYLRSERSHLEHLFQYF